MLNLYVISDMFYLFTLIHMKVLKILKKIFVLDNYLWIQYTK